jgi:hypothetical protein
VDDVAVWCLLAFILAASAAAWLPVLAGLLVYVAGMAFVVRPLLLRYQLSFAAALLLLRISS